MMTLPLVASLLLSPVHAAPDPVANLHVPLTFSEAACASVTFKNGRREGAGANERVVYERMARPHLEPISHKPQALFVPKNCLEGWMLGYQLVKPDDLAVLSADEKRVAGFMGLSLKVEQTLKTAIQAGGDDPERSKRLRGALEHVSGMTLRYFREMCGQLPGRRVNCQASNS